MEDDLKKNEMEDDLNFKAVLLSLFNNKNLKKNGFDTIEIDLVLFKVLFMILLVRLGVELMCQDFS
jgi:hypothetical protein